MPKKEIVDHVEWETDDSPEESEKSRPSAASGRKSEKKGKKKHRRKRRNVGLTILIILLVLLLLIVLLSGACIYLLRTGKLNVLLGKTIQYNGDEEIRHVAETVAGRLNAAGGKYTVTKADTSIQKNYTYYQLRGRSGSWLLIPDAVVQANNGTAFVDNIVASNFAVRSVTPEETYISLVEGDSREIGVSIAPDTAMDTELSWLSADPGIATVDPYGLITAVAYGDTNVTATAPSGAFAAISVHVQALPSGIELEESVFLGVGEVRTLSASVLPAHSVQNDLTWESSDPGVVTVDANGVLTGVGGGEASVTCGTANGIYASCEVTVYAEVVSITLDPASITVHTGDTFSVDASPVPANAVDATLRYSVSDDTVLSNDGNGQFTALKSGEATITVSSGTGVTAECHVTVEYSSNGPEILKISKKYKKDSNGLYWLRMTVHTTKDVSKVELYYYRTQSVYQTDYKPDEKGDEYIWYVGYPVSEHGGSCRFRVTAYGENGQTDSKSFDYQVPVLGHD